MGSEPDRQRIAIDLKKWLHSQTKYRTLHDVAKATGIPYNTLKKYFGGKRFPSGRRLDSLTQITGIPALDALRQQEREARALPRQASPSMPKSPEEAARELMITLHRLMNDLNYFKRGSDVDRVLLRKIVPARDVGYVTSLLKAMYDEDQFQAWVYFADYNPESR